MDNSDFTESMRKVLTNKLNAIFLANLVNNLGAIIEPEDFADIFIVDSDHPHKRLLQVTLNLTPKTAFWEESLSGQVFSSFKLQRQNSRGAKAKPQPNPPKEIEEVEKEVDLEVEGQIIVDGMRRSTRKVKKPKNEDYVE